MRKSNKTKKSVNVVKYKSKSAKKNNRRVVLFGLLLLLVFTFTLCGVSTYSWLLVNNTIDIRKFDVEITTIEGIQISADASEWSGYVSFDELLDKGRLNQFPYSVDHTSSSGNVVDGFLKLYHGNVKYNMITGEALLSTTGTGSEVNCLGLACPDNANFVAFDIYLRAEVPTRINLSNGSKVVSSDGKGLDYTARVAFLLEDFVEEGDEEGLFNIFDTYNATEAYIWEPNCDAHTGAGIKNAVNNYGFTKPLPTDALPYYAVNSDILESKSINVKDTWGNSYFYDMTKFPRYIATKKKNTTDNRLFTIQPGITKIRVYLWLEGQDVDTEDEAAKSDLTLTLEFAVAD